MRPTFSRAALLFSIICAIAPHQVIGEVDQAATAHSGGIAIVGRVTDSTLNAYSRDPADVVEIARLLAGRDTEATARHAAELRAESLAAEANLTTQQMLIFLSILAKHEVRLEQVPATMAEITENYRRMQERYTTLAPQDPSAVQLVRQAMLAGEDGRFDEADRLLQQAEDREGAAIDEHRVEVAGLRAARGANAAAQLQYDGAAKHYQAAAASLPSGHPDEKGRYLVLAAGALQTSGEQRGDSVTLTQSTALYTDALKEITRERDSLEWARIQMDLGNALAKLGESESGTVHLEQAIEAYQLALQVRTRDHGPLEWARTQMNLANALETLGERESGTGHLEQAIQAYQLALEERTRGRGALEWARTQMNLGAALGALGERESGNVRLEEAIRVFQLALQELTCERVPLEWAWTQMNLGVVFTKLGEREGGIVSLEQAIHAFRLALKKLPRERVPMDWATTQNDLGSALSKLGEREAGTVHLAEAVTAWEMCLTVTEPVWPMERVRQVHARIDNTRSEIARRLVR